jgi:hypothetical protein
MQRRFVIRCYTKSDAPHFLMRGAAGMTKLLFGQTVLAEVEILVFLLVITIKRKR